MLPPYTRLGNRCSFIRELPAGNADACLRQASDPEISRSLFGLLLHSQKAFNLVARCHETSPSPISASYWSLFLGHFAWLTPW